VEEDQSILGRGPLHYETRTTALWGEEISIVGRGITELWNEGYCIIRRGPQDSGKRTIEQ
jgi:hypothetical protein